MNTNLCRLNANIEETTTSHQQSNMANLPHPYSTKDIINGREVMQMLKIISRTAFKRMRERGEIPFHTRSNGLDNNYRRIFYYHSEINALLHPLHLTHLKTTQSTNSTMTEFQQVPEFIFDGNILIRTKIINGEPYFVAKDVCKCLGITNNRDVMSRLDDDEKDEVGIIDAIGRAQQTTIVNESGLYSLIFQSRKPKAKAFRKWVTSEVLPQLRKRGYYGIPQKNSTEVHIWTGYYSTTSIN